MRGFRYTPNVRTSPPFLQDDLNREHVLPGGAKVDPASIPPDAHGRRSLPAGTLLGRTFAEREAGAPSSIVDGWMHSPGHRRNILRRGFTEIGVAIATDGDRATYVTTFGRR